MPISRRPKKPVNEAHLPAVHVMVVNALAAGGATVIRAVRGQPVRRTAEEQAACLAICHGCDLWIHESARCSVCGCFGNWKAKLAASDCPKGKWPARIDTGDSS